MREQTPRWQIGLRAALWLGLVIWMVGGPFANQVLNQEVPGVKRWLMFIGYGKDICEVRFLLPGQTEPVDRLKVLGYEHAWQAPRKDKMLATPEDVARQGRALCKELGVDALQVQGRCGALRGWKPIGKPPWPQDKNLCAR